MRKAALRALSIAGVLVISFFVSSCSSGEGAAEETQAAGNATSITIECEENLLFSRYDLDVFVDEAHQGSMDHGTSKTFDVNLSDGEHTLRITEKDNGSVDGSVDFSVDGDASLKYKVKCTNSQVEIEAVETLNPPVSSSDTTSMYHDEVHRAFEEAGFSNIKEEELRDLPPKDRNRNWYTGSVSIAGKDDFTQDDSFLADDEVVIAYHVLADLNPPASSDELEGKNYEEVVKQFEKAGYINVTATAINGSGTAGTVSSVRIGGLFGSSNFSKADTFPFDDGVEITYYKTASPTGDSEQPSDEETSTEVPSEDLSKLLSSSDTNASWFSSAYRGRTITFDGWVAGMMNHENYNTRYDVLILAGSNGSSPMTGPDFRLTNVNFYDMNITNSSSLREGDNITVTAIVGEYNPTSDWLELDPVYISIR